MILDLTPDELLTTTRAVRKRLDLGRPVERSVIEECLDIAMQAPTGSNMQNWHWVVVTDPALRAELAEIYREGARGYLLPADGETADDPPPPGDDQQARVVTRPRPPPPAAARAWSSPPTAGWTCPCPCRSSWAVRAARGPTPSSRSRPGSPAASTTPCCWWPAR